MICNKCFSEFEKKFIGKFCPNCGEEQNDKVNRMTEGAKQ